MIARLVLDNLPAVSQLHSPQSHLVEFSVCWCCETPESNVSIKNNIEDEHVMMEVEMTITDC